MFFPELGSIVVVCGFRHNGLCIWRVILDALEDILVDINILF